MNTTNRQNYAIIGKFALQDKRLSSGAKGLYAFLSIIPDSNSFTKTSLPLYFKEGKTAINARFKELVNHGYIKVTKQLIGGIPRHCYELLLEPKES